VREEVRALALIGEPADVDLAIAAATKANADLIVADAVARRGGEEALELYATKLRALRSIKGFFRTALWGHTELIGPTAGKLLAAGDERGWDDLLHALLDSTLSLPPQRAVAALESASEAIRSATAWYVVSAFSADPSVIREPLRATLLAARAEQGSDREDYARELLRRMLGREPSDPERWLKWLATKEGDDTLPREAAVYAWLTPKEYATRESRCKLLPVSCPIGKVTLRAIPSVDVRQADFQLPGTLPPGLADHLRKDLRSCRWIGVASATVDHAGRVQSVDLGRVATACKDVLETIVKLSYATNKSITTPLRTGDIVLAKDRGADVCLDALGDDLEVHAVGGDVVAPVIKRRAEPHFPENVRRQMPHGANVLVVVESVISRTGCVRSVRLVSQSPYPALNGEALLALSKWTFTPARLGGKPVDVVFDLTINFSLK
jgi:TonB family protein